MTWKPVQTDHAIERVRLIFRFAQPLPDKLITNLGHEVECDREALGFNSLIFRDANQITFGPHGPEDSFGWHLQRGASQYGPTEVLALHRQAVIYETSDYSRWNFFIERAEKVVSSTLNRCADVDDIHVMTLEYIDRFIFDGNPDEARPSELFDGIDGLLGEDALSGKQAWHIHRGWFETLGDDNILVNQNFDSQEAEFEDNKRTKSVQVITKLELRKILSEVDFSNIKLTLDVMHDRSNKVFGSLLTEQMVKRIRLNGN